MAVKRFLSDERAAASIEYVILLLPLIALVFTSFQIALAYHFALTAQKAVQLGARIAAVRDPVSVAMPRENTLDTSSGFEIGDPCGLGACVDPGGPWTCTGAEAGSGQCDAAAFAEIYSEVGRVAYLLQPGDLTVRYSYGRLGFAGGPFTPIVEVIIEERPFFLQFFFNLAFGSGEDSSNELRLPAVAASAIAEDLSSTN